MAPPVEVFPAWQLSARVQTTADGKRRKEAVQLRDCELKEMVQYSCELFGPREDPNTPAVCEPIVRLFRRCADGLTVETTATEGVFT